MNWLIWVIWIIRIAFNLIGKIGRFREEVPEAIQSINQARQEIANDLAGGLTEEEVERIKLKLSAAWDEIDDVLELFSGVIPVPQQQEL